LSSLYFCFSLLFFSLLPPRLSSILFPYTTLFRSFYTIHTQHILSVPTHHGQSLCGKKRPPQRLDCSTFVGIGQRKKRPFGSKRRSEEHTSELQSRFDLVCRLLLEKRNTSVCELTE